MSEPYRIIGRGVIFWHKNNDNFLVYDIPLKIGYIRTQEILISFNINI